MTIKRSADEAARDFTHLLDSVAAGEDVLIERDGEPLARVVRASEAAATGLAAARLRSLGLLEGKYRVPDHFNAPLPDEVLDLFEAPIPSK